MTRKTNARSGTAVVELAICLPIIFVIVFASIEACNMIALKQIISESAYDGALNALRPDSEEAEIIASINAVLAARNVTPSNVLVEGEGGSGYDSIGHGDTVTVTVAAETNGNVVGPQLFGFAKTVSCTTTAIKQ
jgi:Flp pilus assembly protein TadG